MVIASDSVYSNLLKQIKKTFHATRFVLSSFDFGGFSNVCMCLMNGTQTLNGNCLSEGSLQTKQPTVRHLGVI